jgi:hypothetical protein
MSDYDEEGKRSVFNAGVAQTERIDSLQRAINAARFNLVAVNYDTGTFNYEVIISACDGLMNEAWAKLDASEKTFSERIRGTVKKFIEANPPFKKNNGEVKVSNENFKKMSELLDLYEKTTKRMLDSHDLNSPNRDDDEGL